MIAANHASFLDGLLLGAFLPGTPVFAIDTFVAQKWWVKPFLSLVDAMPIDPTNPLSLRGDDPRGRRRRGVHHLSRRPHHDDRQPDEGL